MSARILFLALSGALILSSCQSSPTDLSETETVKATSLEIPESEDLDPDGIVCTYEKIVGKLIKEKICYTRKQKLDLREESQRAADTIEQRSRIID